MCVFALLQLDFGAQAAFLQQPAGSSCIMNENNCRYKIQTTCRRRRRTPNALYFQPTTTTHFNENNSCRNPAHVHNCSRLFPSYSKPPSALFSTIEDTTQNKNRKKPRRKRAQTLKKQKVSKAEAKANRLRGKSTYTQAMKPVARVNVNAKSKLTAIIDGNNEAAIMRAAISKFAQLDGMLQHKLLTREEEKMLSKAVLEGQRIRNQITSILEERQAKKKTTCSLEPPRYKAMAKMRRTTTRELKLVTEGARYYGDQSRFEEDQISEDEVISMLQLEGGKAEMRLILQEATDARNKMIECNLKLVTSIAKKFLKMQMEKSGQAQLNTFGYVATWDLPSLEELVQEGILGLTRAVDKYDSKYGYKFSTYATYWITSHVRTCLRKTSTGVVTIPRQITELRNKYNILIRDYYMMNKDPPREEAIAEELEVTVRRLRLCLRATQPISSLDGPTYSDMIAPFSTSDDSSSRSYLSLANIMKSDDSQYDPETYVDLSLLRQSLENAMSSQLSPHERDIIRLRLGLDNGHARSVADVVNICGGGVSKADVRSVERKAYRKLKIYHESAEYLFLQDWEHVGTP